jgi:transmembrane sensor
VSEPGLEDAWKNAHASAAEASAARWLARQEHSDWSEADQNNLNVWLAESAVHMVAYLRLSDAWSRADRLAALRAPMRKTLGAVDRNQSKIIVQIVSIVLLLVGFATFAITSLRNNTPETTYSTPVGGREIIALSDGSQVELNTDTVLQIANGNARSVNLVKGEAFFQIKHNAKRPFVVTAFGHRITDLGTKFAVSGVEQHLTVTLVEGRARVDTGHASAVLTPGDVAVVTQNHVSVSRKAPTTLSDKLAWRQGMLVFNRATLTEVAEQFNRYNSRKIVITDPVAAQLAVMGKFPVNDVDLFGRVAKAVLGVTIVNRGDRLFVSSKQVEK